MSNLETAIIVADKIREQTDYESAACDLLRSVGRRDLATLYDVGPELWLVVLPGWSEGQPAGPYFALARRGQ